MYYLPAFDEGRVGSNIVFVFCFQFTRHYRYAQIIGEQNGIKCSGFDDIIYIGMCFAWNWFAVFIPLEFCKGVITIVLWSQYCDKIRPVLFKYRGWIFENERLLVGADKYIMIEKFS